MSDDHEIELIFHGTGTSCGVPNIECITAPPTEPQCLTCRSSVLPGGERNKRRNTGAIIRKRANPNEWTTVVIDVGKTFLASALEWFPKYGLRRIDGVVISHPHADAMNGLDDLRGWTLGGAIQKHIDVFLTETTYREVKRCFPYLVDKQFASGGGDIPDFQWHIIQENTPFEVKGISILPFRVQHGRLFTTGSPPALNVPTPGSPLQSGMTTPLLLENAAARLLPSGQEPVVHPYWTLGFAVDDAICWISDVSHIPDDTWDVLTARFLKGCAVLVIDCLNLRPHTSHFGIRDSIATAARVGATQSYLIGFGHRVPHQAWLRLCQCIGEGTDIPSQEEPFSEIIARGLEMIEKMDIARAPYVRPSYDGLRLKIHGLQVVEDSL